MTLAFEYEMTYAETIEGPIGPTTGSPLGERVCWQVVTGSLRAQLVTDDAS